MFQGADITSGDLGESVPVASALQCALLCADPSLCSAALLTPPAVRPDESPEAMIPHRPQFCRLVRPGPHTVTVGEPAGAELRLLLPVL